MPVHATRLAGFHPTKALSAVPARWSIVVVLLASLPAPAAVAQTVRQDTAQQNVVVYTQSPDRVADALTAVLVARSELPAAMAPEVTTSLVQTVEERREGRLSGRSISLDRAGLERLIPPQYARHVSDAGGRYVVSVIFQQIEDGGTRLTVIPIIIAAVPGAHGPLGGRLLRSNGLIESEIFQAMAAQLGG
jgi:hypothetical protein